MQVTRKWILPLTYAPKIQAVLSGECRQTIRVGTKIMPCDLVLFHGWSGKPYHSPWSFRTPYFRICLAWPVIIFPGGMRTSQGPLIKWRDLDNLAKEDGIDPPTGEELWRVLSSMHQIPREGVDAKILRWEPEAVPS